MRSSNIFAGFFVSVAFLLSGCDDIKDKLGMAEKKESASKEDSKDKKDKKKDADDEEEDEKPKAGSSASAAAPASASAAPTAPSAPLGAPGKAAAHLPSDCDGVVTLNIAKVLAHPAFASQVVPALDEAMKKASTEGPEAAKVDAFFKETGISPRAFSDIALCIKDGGSEPLVGFVAAGSITPDSIVPAIEKGDPSAKDKIKDLDGRKVLSDGKFTLGQYSDGSLGFAQTDDMFRAMGGTGDAATAKYRIDGNKEISLVIPEGSIAKLAKGQAPAELSSVKSISISLDLTGGKAVVRAATTSADEAKKLEAMFNLLKSEAGGKLAGAPPGTAELLKSATTRVEGNDLVIEAALPADAMSSLATLIAAGLKEESGAAVDSLFKGDGKTATKTEPAKPGTTAATPPTKPTATTPTTKPTATTPAATAKRPGGGLKLPGRK